MTCAEAISVPGLGRQLAPWRVRALIALHHAPDRRFAAADVWRIPEKLQQVSLSTSGVRNRRDSKKARAVPDLQGSQGLEDRAATLWLKLASSCLNTPKPYSNS